MGKEGLKRKTKNSNYSIQFKLDVVNYMIINKSSIQQTAKMNNPSLIVSWKLKYLNGGLDELSKKKERPPMNKKKENKNNNLSREQQLEHQNEVLRSEIAFLKKLRASRMNVPKKLKTNTKQK